MNSANVIKTIHYRPADGFFGDPIPFWHDGTWHVFFNKLKLDNSIVWGHVATNDFVHWQEHPDALTNGPAGALDEFMCATGSIVEKDNLFHLFYTGAGRGGYSLIKATSTDLSHWEKENHRLVDGGEEWYRQDGLWRDPCVFWNPEEECWWMVFCTRVPADGANFLPGAMGLAKSKDLENWRLSPPAWAESLSGWVECPDVFRHAGKWVLCYFWRDTKFRFSDSPSGPWHRARVEAPSGLDFSAGKTATDGRRRIVFGQIPRKDCDCSLRTCGGELAIPREFYLHNDGTPCVRYPLELDAAFSQDAMEGRGAGVFATLSGRCQAEKDRLQIDSEDSGTVLLWNSCPADYCLGFNLSFKENAGTLSFILRSGREAFARDPYSTAADVGYELLFDAYCGRVCLREHYEYNQKPDIASIQYDFSAERRTGCRMFLHGQLLEIFLGNQRSLIVRLLKHPAGGLALVVRDGSVSLEDFFIRTIG